MLCPHCQAPNPDDSRFCENCGQPLERACPKCGQPVSPSAKFCRHCGQALAAAPASPLTPLDQYIPKELRAKLEAARATGEGVEGERRVVTMLFCDVKGSTAAAEKLDPEEWAEVMNGAFEHLIAPIYRYEGTLARLMGDAILAFFGAPIAHEDDPQRAVRAGLEIVAGIQTYRDQLKRERGLDLNVRVGLNTGLVVVGEVGSDLRVEYTAMGDAINLAARMEQTAQPGTVQITGEMHKLVAPLFDCEDLGGIEVKGKAGPVTAYRVLGLKAQPGRLRGIEGWETPLVGREREMAELLRVMAEVQQGHGRIVCLIGEAGLGKSRLIQELRGAWQATAALTVDPHLAVVPSWTESQGLSHDTTRPYGLFRQLFRHLSGATENDPSSLVLEKMEAALKGAPPEQHLRVARFFESLLSLAAPASETAPSSETMLEGEALKRELFSVALDTLRSWSRARPFVLVFDDLHWADSASIELLLHLFQLADEAPILFLCAFRPDRQSPAWRVKQTAERDYAHRYTELALHPLSAEEGQALVDRLPAMAELPVQLRQNILDRAEGNPLFVEEIARALIDNGVIIVREAGGWRAAAEVDPERIIIPTNLQALLLARLDRLEEETRRALQLASVIGRSFYVSVLKTVVGPQTDLGRCLLALQRADLIRETARQPELEYTFRHALTQEAAYNSILIKRRREFHRRVGEALETQLANQLEAFAGQLGRHFDLAGDERALKYYTLAGDAAYRLYANVEAVEHYSRALEIARRAGQADSLQHLYARRGRALELSARYREAVANYEEMESTAREGNDRPLELSALMLRTTIYASHNPEHDAARAQELSKQSLVLAHELNDGPAEARILWNLLLVCRATGQSGEALRHGEESLAIARRLNLREQMAFTLNDLIGVHWMSGDMRQAQAVQFEARDLWRELGNLPMLADNLARSTQIHLAAGDYAATIAASDEAYAISQSIGNVWGQSNSRIGVGLAYWDQGDYGRAITVQEEAIALGERVGHTIALTFIPAVLALVYGEVGNISRGFELANAGLAHVRARVPDWSSLPLITLAKLHLLNGNLPATGVTYREAVQNLVENNLRQVSYVWLLWLSLIEAELALAHGDHARALTLADKLIAEAHRAPYRPFIPEALYFKGKVLRAQGRIDPARQALDEARTEAGAMGSRRTLWPILMALHAIESDSKRASDLARQARQIVDDIADGLPGSARATFLDLPTVRAMPKSQAVNFANG